MREIYEEQARALLEQLDLAPATRNRGVVRAADAVQMSHMVRSVLPERRRAIEAVVALHADPRLGGEREHHAVVLESDASATKALLQAIRRAPLGIFRLGDQGTTARPAEGSELGDGPRTVAFLQQPILQPRWIVGWDTRWPSDDAPVIVGVGLRDEVRDAGWDAELDRGRATNADDDAFVRDRRVVARLFGATEPVPTAVSGAVAVQTAARLGERIASRKTWSSYFGEEVPLRVAAAYLTAWDEPDAIRLVDTLYRERFNFLSYPYSVRLVTPSSHALESALPLEEVATLCGVRMRKTEPQFVAAERRADRLPLSTLALDAEEIGRMGLLPSSTIAAAHRWASGRAADPLAEHVLEEVERHRAWHHWSRAYLIHRALVSELREASSRQRRRERMSSDAYAMIVNAIRWVCPSHIYNLRVAELDIAAGNRGRLLRGLARDAGGADAAERLTLLELPERIWDAYYLPGVGRLTVAALFDALEDVAIADDAIRELSESHDMDDRGHLEGSGSAAASGASSANEMLADGIDELAALFDDE